MDSRQDIVARTRSFAISVMNVADSMRRTRATDVVARQVIRSGTSAGANYREAKRARSRSEFISKTTVAFRQMHETRYWLELIENRRLANVDEFLAEVDELIRLRTAPVSTAKRRTNDGR